jgi:hypothetical protein
MLVKNWTIGARSALRATLILGALGFGVTESFAAKLGPYFPLPNSFNIVGTPKEGLLKLQATWLENGLDNLKKARAKTAEELEKAIAAAAKPEQTATLEEKIKALDAEIDATVKELEIANDVTPGKEVQGERKRLFLLNVHQWLNELSRLAIQQMKIAILKDGVEAQVAQSQHIALTETADKVEKALHDHSVEIWGN